MALLVNNIRQLAERDAARDLRRGNASAVESHMARDLPAASWDPYRDAYDARVRSLCTDEEYLAYQRANGLAPRVDPLSARSVSGVPYPTYDDFLHGWLLIAQAVAADFAPSDDGAERDDCEPTYAELGYSTPFGAYR